MNRQLLLALQKRNNERLVTLRSKIEDPELRAADLPAIQTEIEDITKQLQDIADELAKDDNNDGADNSTGNGDNGNSDGGTNGDGSNGEGRDGEPGGDNGEGDEGQRGAVISVQQRSSAMNAISSALSTRANQQQRQQRTDAEVRAAFANFVVGKISEAEARSLGVETGNGSVTIPEVIASEIITYAQQENLLRKYGSVHRESGNVKYPVLVKKADANVRKKERGSDDNITETEIEFDEILLDPAEFDALATVTKKLLKMTGAPIETIVIDELKKAYVRKETNYMFKGNDVGNENPGALEKKAVAYYETEAIDINAAGYSQKLYQQLVKLKGQPVTEVLKKSMWIINRSALTILEGMTDTTGRPLLHEAKDGVGYTLLGHQVDFTDSADGADPKKPVFYFGDFKAFHIQDVIGAMELQKLVEKYAGTNKVGFQIYNLLDGQLIYSPYEPAVYRYEVGATKGA